MDLSVFTAANAEPISIFSEWLREAEQSEPNDPNAAALATAGADGQPCVRMVLVKQVDERGFCFYTNALSRKGEQLAEDPRAALCFHWKSLRRQVRVEGAATHLDDATVDAYFHSRSRASQVGAAVSRQSRPLASRELLLQQVAKFADSHPGEIPRPDFWQGFRIVPERIEFWIDGADRLHDRFLFTRNGQHRWQVERLYP